MLYSCAFIIHFLIIIQKKACRPPARFKQWGGAPIVKDTTPLFLYAMLFHPGLWLNVLLRVGLGLAYGVFGLLAV